MKRISNQNTRPTNKNATQDVDKISKEERKKISASKSKKRSDNAGDKTKNAETAVVQNKRKIKKSLAKTDLEEKEKSGAKKDVEYAPKERQKIKRKSTKFLQERVDAEIEQKSSADDFDVKKLSKKHILKCIDAIFQLTEEKPKNNIFLAEEAEPIFMQVTSIKVPTVSRRHMRILLPHSIVPTNEEVALFVCDLQKGRRKDYEPTVEHYKSLLNEHECARVNEIIPMNRVKTEYDQFELKRKLVASYDHFLVDGRIAGHMNHLLGKEFYKKRKLPIPIRMQSKDLKHEIEHSLRKTSMHLHSHGDSHTMQIGNTLMDKKEILKNVLAACKYLSKNYPGGWANIRSLRLKSRTSLALPIYVTLKNKNTVKVPVVQPRRPKAYRDVEGDLSTFVSDAKVIVKPEGDIILERKRTRRKHVGKRTSESEA